MICLWMMLPQRGIATTESDDVSQGFEEFTDSANSELNGATKKEEEEVFAEELIESEEDFLTDDDFESGDIFESDTDLESKDIFASN